MSDTNTRSVVAKPEDDIILGSGTLYIVDAPSTGEIPTKTEDATIEVTENHMGDIKGGARLSYKITDYEVTNDKGEVRKRVITKEEGSFKSGVLSWILENLPKLIKGEFSKTDAEKIFRLGKGNRISNKMIRFVHEKDDGKKLRFTMLGTPTNGIEFTLDPSKETVLDAEFKAINAKDGTIIEIREEI